MPGDTHHVLHNISFRPFGNTGDGELTFSNGATCSLRDFIQAADIAPRILAVCAADGYDRQSQERLAVNIRHVVDSDLWEQGKRADLTSNSLVALAEPA